ncbi:MAG: L-serine ammonia-lyase [Planctomycetes bacterium]|nr:L-serine ammonia-lyase [Planctomycetota bacterium]
MVTSAFDMYRVGVGPSSSHTVGPMRAAFDFRQALLALGGPAPVARVTVTLHGSLALTGRSHHTHLAVTAGLLGMQPATAEPGEVLAAPDLAHRSGGLPLPGRLVAFDPERVIVAQTRERPAGHPNTLVFRALDAGGAPLLERTYESIGGGFVRPIDDDGAGGVGAGGRVPPRPFSTMADLLGLALAAGTPLSAVIIANERAAAGAPEQEVIARMLAIWRTMDACIESGLQAEGLLPGGLRVARRAGHFHRATLKEPKEAPLHAVRLAQTYALAVNEENAAGGRVVTAPTNGAAGVIPAVMRVAREVFGAGDEAIARALFTAAGVGMIIKEHASISGAEVGCMGEVGSAAAMAAAALTELRGGAPGHVEYAAEIAIEHSLGLTCDPIAGLVQIPCIERNAMGAVKALSASEIALVTENGAHQISLDRVIRVMKRTGEDMQTKYKETALGGLAVSHVEC